MIYKLVRSVIVLAAFALAGCQVDDIKVGSKAERPLPDKLIKRMKTKGMSLSAPIMVRIFKEENELEVWKQTHNGRYDLVTSYEICKWSGKLGPKYVEGDRQAPEGFYTIRPAQMNPLSQYHLAFNLGYPNRYDRSRGRTGAHLMVHGDCSSSGCYAMTDDKVEEIYAFARDSFRGGQREFQVQAFPFRMTAANMTRYRNDENYAFWQMLKEGYDLFELTKQPPKVDVCGKKYVFNRVPEAGKVFSPNQSCPPSTQPDSLRLAYETHTLKYQEEYAELLSKPQRNKQTKIPPAPSINGIKEARLVSVWSKKRAAGQTVPAQPPSLNGPPAK